MSAGEGQKRGKTYKKNKSISSGRKAAYNCPLKLERNSGNGRGKIDPIFKTYIQRARAEMKKLSKYLGKGIKNTPPASGTLNNRLVSLPTTGKKTKGKEGGVCCAFRSFVKPH